MPTSPVSTFSASPLQPVYQEPEAIFQPFTFGASQTLAKGTVIAIKTSDSKAYAYNGAKVADPAVAAVMTDGAAGTFPAGVYTGFYTLVTANGESLPSPATSYLSVGTKKIHFAILAGLNAAVTKVNFYINGSFAIQQAVVANATPAFDFDLANFVSGSPAPTVSAAFSAAAGLQNPVGLLEVDIVTDASGNVVFGTSTPGEFGQTNPDAPVYVHGFFSCADLTGLDANAVSKLGRLVYGTTAAGILSIN